jgi:pimeloyl-ACP methyl ester carboxylesterase
MPLCLNPVSDYDWSATPERSRGLADAIKGAIYTQMEGMGHFPMFEHPEPFKKYLARLLATIMTR